MRIFVDCAILHEDHQVLVMARRAASIMHDGYADLRTQPKAPDVPPAERSGLAICLKMKDCLASCDGERWPCAPKNGLVLRIVVKSLNMFRMLVQRERVSRSFLGPSRAEREAATTALKA